MFFKCIANSQARLFHCKYWLSTLGVQLIQGPFEPTMSVRSQFLEAPDLKIGKLHVVQKGFTRDFETPNFGKGRSGCLLALLYEKGR